MSVPHGTIPTQSFNKSFPNLAPLIATQLDLELLAKTMLDVNARGPITGSSLPAGYTYFGQFIDHDLTFDNTSVLTAPADLNTLQNTETNLFDLSSVYGITNTSLNANGLFNIGKTPNGDDDLPRDANGNAIIADPRNDENLIVSQLHLAFLKFHNKVFTDIKTANPTFTLAQLITQAKQTVVWHYQWLVVHDFLADICGKFFTRIIDANGNLTIHPNIKSMYPNIPIEFTGAIYRFGHSMVRDAYYVNSAFDVFPIFSPILPPPLVSIPDLRGSRPIPASQAIDWSMFFPMPFHKGFQVAENFDNFITESLYNLPIPTVVAAMPNILPLRNLIRGTFTYQLPSGQDLATAMGIPANEILKASSGNMVFQTLNPLVTATDINHLTTVFGEQTPLFYYILKDNHVNGNGQHLGSLASKFIGDTFLSLLSNDASSYLNNKFSPVQGSFGCITNGIYRFAEFFTYALGLPAFTANDIIPNSQTNFFDPFENNIGKIAPVGHPLVPSLGVPGAALDVVLTAYPGRTINAYDPTLTLPVNCTQAEVNQVATNAVKFKVDSTLAVVRFTNNKTILGIAQNLIAPLAPPAPIASVFPPAVLPPPDVLPTITLSADQKRALAIFNETDVAQFMLKPQAILDAARAAKEINDALFGLVAPPITLVV